jgi:hypothetical protein
MLLRWLNYSQLHQPANYPMNLSSFGITSLNGTLIKNFTENFYFERMVDCRMQIIDDNQLYLIFSRAVEFNHDRNYIVDIRVDHNKRAYVNTHTKIHPTFDSHRSQKNWVPFMYNDTLHLIQYINPLHIVRLNEFKNESIDVSHQSERVILGWPEFCGFLRGGTNAILMNRNNESFYLAFFHSHGKMPNERRRKTTFFGAFTFTSSPPFKLLKTSKNPIVNSLLYSGHW